MLEGLSNRLNLGVRLLVSVPFHRLWKYGQQIHGIAADSADYLRHNLDKFVAEKGDAKTISVSVATLSIYICFCTIFPPQNLYNGI